MPGLRHLEPKTVGMTGLAVVLGLAVLSMAEVAVDRFREVMDRNVRVFLAVGERVASLVDVGVAGQALFRRDGLEAVLVAHRAVLLVLGGRRNGDIGGVGAGREKRFISEVRGTRP